MTGSICERKNQIDCVRVLEALREKGVDAHLVLIGPAGEWDYTKKMRDHIAERQLGDFVHQLGERTDTVAILSAMDAYLCTSVHEEGPIATLEALSVGLPVITSHIGCMPVVMADDKGGKVLPVGDWKAMSDFAADLAGDPAQRQRMGAEGRNQVKTILSPETIIPQVEAVYREVVR